ncbi:MAG: DsrE/DsrF/TusD sulfur relay family protein [Fervidobacterium sp.]|uniref:DsrE/DsrF/TusD sulfur relay family protein n=1 Tax=Fervidobacterium sp. TaxID=1871331 RepID=UPI00404B6139
MKIAIQVMVPPYTNEDLDTAIHIAEAALARGHEVTIFLFADSILSINSKVKPIRTDRNIPQKMKELASKGVHIEICGICMDYRGVTEDMIVEGSRPSGLPELASLFANCDRFISLMA